MKNIFQLNNEKNESFWRNLWIFSGIALIIAKEFLNNSLWLYLILFFLSFLIVINSFQNKILNLKENILSLSLTFIILLYSLYEITINFQSYYDIFSFYIIIFLLSFSAIFVYLGYYFHYIFWKNNILNFKSNWEAVNIEVKSYQDKVKLTLIITSIMIILLHLYLAFQNFNVLDLNIFFIHHISISIIIFLLIIYFCVEIKKLNKKRKQNLVFIFSRTQFLILVLFIIYDLLLEIYSFYIFKSTNIVIIFLILFYLFSLFNPKLNLPRQ